MLICPLGDKLQVVRQCHVVEAHVEVSAHTNALLSLQESAMRVVLTSLFQFAGGDGSLDRPRHHQGHHVSTHERRHER